ncbi:MAG: T7SS effector LXG polymorphic toxin [Lachnospiraceae bacterium]|nr:T7SS effector LXG polymorphic toxin [Lachnospiraceae bacterium]
MGVKMNTSSVFDELEMMNTYLMNAEWKCGTIKSSLESYTSNTELDGVAYNNHKNYIAQMQQPVINGVERFCSEMRNANNKYRTIIESHFGAGWDLDEDAWRQEYNNLKVQYEAATSTINVIMETLRSMLMGGGGSYGVQVDNMYVAVRTYQEEIDTLYDCMQYYSENLEKLGQMVAETAGVYEGASTMQAALAAAISALQSVPFNASTNLYSIDVVNREPFDNLNDAWEKTCLIHDIQSVLGDEWVDQESFDLMSTEEQTEYIATISKLITPLLPSISAKIASGKLEIPIGNGISFYAEITQDGKIDTGNDVTLSAARAENGALIASWSATVGGLSGKMSRNKTEVKITYPVNDHMTTYTSVSINEETYDETLEYGVTNQITDNCSVSEKVGITYRNQEDGGWEVVNVDSFETDFDTIKKPEAVLNIPFFGGFIESFPIPAM